MAGKERVEMYGVNVRGTLCLRQGEIEKEDGFESRVQWNPDITRVKSKIGYGLGCLEP